MIGYTYYHAQDAETTLSGILILSYSSCDSPVDWSSDAGLQAHVNIGRRTQAALEASGLAVGWDGSVYQPSRFMCNGAVAVLVFLKPEDTDP